MKMSAILLYAGLLLVGVGTSAWRLANPIKVAAVTCSNKNCWDGTPGGSDVVCKNFNKNCTSCGGYQCNDVL